MKKFTFSGRYQKRAQIDLTPLVDLVFLLVIFFMVSSTIGKQSVIHINLPVAEKSTLSEDVSLIISINELNEIFIGEEKISAENFLSEVSARKDSLSQKKILIRGDKKTNYETIILVMDSLNKTGISAFTLSTVRQ